MLHLPVAGSICVMRTARGRLLGAPSQKTESGAAHLVAGLLEASAHRQSLAESCHAFAPFQSPSHPLGRAHAPPAHTSVAKELSLFEAAAVAGSVPFFFLQATDEHGL